MNNRTPFLLFCLALLASVSCSSNPSAPGTDAALPELVADVAAGSDTAAMDTAEAWAGDVGPDGEVGTPPARLSPLECLLAPDCDRAMVAAHRGYHVGHPENSLAGLRAAAAIGADFVEVDVRHTADEVLVLMHDATVNRTTTGEGVVESLTYAALQDLELLDADPDDPESRKIPRFDQAMALARELGVMLYVDQKTSRWDLVLAEIQAGEFYDVALVRDGLGTIELMAPEDPKLLVMPAVDFEMMLDGALLAVENLVIVELSNAEVDPDFNAYAHSLGVKVQQDVMAGGDLLAVFDDYSGWQAFVEGGVDLVQTDMPAVLIPLVDQWSAADPGR